MSQLHNWKQLHLLFFFFAQSNNLRLLLQPGLYVLSALLCLSIVISFVSFQQLWWMNQRHCSLHNDWHNSSCNIYCFLQFIVGRIHFKVTMNLHFSEHPPSIILSILFPFVIRSCIWTWCRKIYLNVQWVNIIGVQGHRETNTFSNLYQQFLVCWSLLSHCQLKGADDKLLDFRVEVPRAWTSERSSAFKDDKINQNIKQI